MADFQTAFRAVMQSEGGYANHPADRGAETYKGISRRWHPSWAGWQRVDALKGHKGTVPFPALLDQDMHLHGLVVAFYRALFWDRVGGNEIPEQAIADELFECSVNLDPLRAVKFLQRAITALWRNPKVDPPIVDGRFGDTTAARLTECLAADPRHLDALLTLLNVQQGAHYLEQLVSYPGQRIYGVGWLKRVGLSRAAHAAVPPRADPA